jgi:hypothetical protein
VADSFTPIGVRDAFIPFIASYRPFWLGLGAIACDLLLALVITSLLRVRLGYRAWRVTHWLAYAAWPLALVHALGTGSDARFGWMAAIALGCMLTVGAAVVVRAAHQGAGRGSLAAIGAVGVSVLGIGLWYVTGPAQPGWAARAGTPTKLLSTPSSARTSTPAGASPQVGNELPRSFAARLSGSIRQSPPYRSGLVTVRIDTHLEGQVGGELRLALQGATDEDGGISLTSSGVAFQDSGTTSVYEGSIVALAGPRVIAELSDDAGTTLRLSITFSIDQATGQVSGSLHGAQI